LAQPFFLNCVTGCNKKLANELILLNRQITPPPLAGRMRIIESLCTKQSIKKIPAETYEDDGSISRRLINHVSCCNSNQQSGIG